MSVSPAKDSAGPARGPSTLAWWALVWAARVGVAGVFFAAAAPKLLAPEAFALDVANYQAFPWWSVNLIAAVVPATELLAALALLVPRWHRPAAAVLLAMDVVFIALIASVMFRGIDIGCGCFGKAEEAEAIGWPTLVRDLLLLGAIVLSGARASASERAGSAAGASRSAADGT